MDLLQQYKEQHPGAFREQKWEPPEGYERYGFFIRLVMRLSGGRIRDVRSASYVLIGFVALAIIVSLLLFFSGGGTTVKHVPVPVIGREFEDVNWPPIAP